MLKFIIPATIVFLIVLFWEKITEFASEGIEALSNGLGFEIETNEPLEGVNLKL